MRSEEHELLHRDLGVYVLGALTPPERDRVELHLPVCEPCREELARLAVLPSMLAKLDEELLPEPPPPFEPVLARLGRQRRRERRRNRIIGGASALAAAALVAVVVALVLPAPADAEHLYLADDRAVTAAISERPWGMRVRIDADELPAEQGYAAFAVARDGHRAYIASWRGVEGDVELVGSCYLSPEEVVRVEIVTGRDDELVRVLTRA